MPIITTALRLKQKGPRIKALHDELRVLGSVVSPSEHKSRAFGKSTRQAVDEFQTRAGVEPTGVVDQVTGRLMTSAVRFANEGASPGLRQELRAAVQASPQVPTLAYWLARYELLAGNYVAAHELVREFPGFPGFAGVIEPVTSVPDPQKPPLPPEVPYPANFYTYRHLLVPPDTIANIREELSQLADPVPLKQRASRVLDAFDHWNQGNTDFIRGLYARAVSHYDACQTAVLSYFRVSNGFDDIEPVPSQEQLVHLITHLSRRDQNRDLFWDFFTRRRGLLSLAELFEHDWVIPARRFPSEANLSSLGAVLNTPPLRERDLEAPLIALAFIFVPLARAEANRLRRQFEAAIQDCRWVIDPIAVDLLPPGLNPGRLTTIMFSQPPGVDGLHPTLQLKLVADFIEIPFARILLAQVLLDKADSQYKARQNLPATQTYMEVQKMLEDEVAYVQRVGTGKDRLTSEINEALANDIHPLVANTTSKQRRTLQTLGKAIPIETIVPVRATLPGLDRQAGPHESLITFEPPSGQPALKETNPLIYALVVEAQARLLQIQSGFNYLGYRDDYVPPWRFQFLLERTRYFAEHAKNAQREYLNFLGNGEQEEFQELSAAQNVTLEQSNVRIETARVEQTRLEVEAAELSSELAELQANNAEARFQAYRAFDKRVDKLDDVRGRGLVRGALDSLFGTASSVPGLGTIATGIGDYFTGGFFSSNNQSLIADEQREFEKFNLKLAISEARKSAAIAAQQFKVAKAGLVVAGLQRAAALLRHEFAVQNLNFLRNRTLNAELWYRLSGLIRGVSDTYMRYAVELAFLVEQAYEFEADKRINVIRFDYDVSEIGRLLAADFLLRDLDTLEQDLIVNQRQRQQQVRYVLSLAREFPEALQDLRDNGSTIFSLRLESIERRFPGLFSVRIGAVEVTPVALMDPTRFSLEMTYLGSSQVRLKAQPDTPPNVESLSPLNANDLPVQPGGWLAEVQQEWPIKIRVTGPETIVFSGLSRPDRATVFPFVSASQRDAFEGLGAAAAWRIDMSMKENQVVPNTLADILITFTLSGYYDQDLRAAVDIARREATTLTQLLSAQQRFADAFYEFKHSGRMTWDVTPGQLSLNVPVRNLRNVGIVLAPAQRLVQFKPLMSTYTVELDVAADSQFAVVTPIPEIGFAISQLAVTAMVNGADGATISWDFGEGGGFQTTNEHTYNRPGKYEIVLRLVSNGRLHEFRAQIAVSRTQTLTAPLTAFPSFVSAPLGQTGILAKASVLPGEEVAVTWKVDQGPAERTPEKLLTLPAGKHVVTFVAVRRLKARIYGQQRFVPDRLLALDGLRISTNRVFELDGSETTGTGQNDAPNALTEHLFTLDPTTSQRLALSPADRWTLELSPDDNPFLRSVTPNDNLQILLDDVEDVILILEYETGESRD